MLEILPTCFALRISCAGFSLLAFGILVQVFDIILNERIWGSGPTVILTDILWSRRLGMKSRCLNIPLSFPMTGYSNRALKPPLETDIVRLAGRAMRFRVSSNWRCGIGARRLECFSSSSLSLGRRRCEARHTMRL